MSTAQAVPLEAPRVEEVSEEALIPSLQGAPLSEPVSSFSKALRLPVELEVAIPLRKFRVRNLLGLQTGVLVESQWVHGDDVPLGLSNVQLAWSEFDVVETQLAVRLTRLV